MSVSSSILITGGTGSLGRAIVDSLLKDVYISKIVVFSRDELKQSQMREQIKDTRIKYVLGDVRDLKSLKTALKGIHLVVHAAALKQVDTIEDNPIQAILTNINGALNVIEASNYCQVRAVVALSTDKACNPINLYGATKLCSDKLFVAANKDGYNTRFMVVRYGNVFTSRGSVVPKFVELAKQNKPITITNPGMTRFSLSLDAAVDLIFAAFKHGKGGELFVAKTASYNLMDLARAVCENPCIEHIGKRPGEKMHEIMISSDEAHLTREYKHYFTVLPPWYESEEECKGRTVERDFCYKSDTNENFLSIEELKTLIQNYE